MTNVQRIAAEDREQLKSLLNLRSTRDAIAAYYALTHPAEKVKLYVNYDGGGRPNGFLALAQTGIDLFRPFVVPFVASLDILKKLMYEAIAPNRSVVLHLPIEQRDWLPDGFELSETRVTELHRLDPRRFNPIINVLVMEVETPSGFPRFEIRSRSGAYAAAGVNWIGNEFAEVYLESDKEAQVRNMAISVLATISQRLLEKKYIPLFRRETRLRIKLETLKRIGYRTTGARFLIGHAIRRANNQSTHS